MAKPWDKYRDIITTLYIQDGRTLEDVQSIMKTEHNFEASIRSFRQHFSIWAIGKYNCKHRQHRQRRRPSRYRPILPAPLRNPTALNSSSKISDIGPEPASSCASQRSLEQLPLSTTQWPPPCAQSPDFDASGLQSSSPPDLCIKIENGGGETGRMDIPMDHSTAPHPPQSMLRSCVPSSSSTNPEKPPSWQERTFPSRGNAHYAYAHSCTLACPLGPTASFFNSHSSHDYYQLSPCYMSDSSPHSDMVSGLRTAEHVW
ncbi:Clr5 domain-containing protein [Fusarium sp. Ph1]|nr:Clr5 domain-containing protein [Fusarium sp. Ph1]